LIHPVNIAEALMQSEIEFCATSDQPIAFVIEGEQVVRSALHYILRERYRTRTFATPDDALADAGEAPDVVLLGVAILQRLGDTALSDLRGRFAGAKILVVAERRSDPLARACIERGVHGIIDKPISFDSVCNVIDTTLAAPRAPGGLSHHIRVAFG
jgi:DNA-binding NarL/FixJ family response regulator